MVQNGHATKGEDAIMLCVRSVIYVQVDHHMLQMRKYLPDRVAIDDSLQSSYESPNPYID